ncbi:hypothetical protein DCM91_20735 [Chitinophaga costaii]|nr:hypothetical protein DCM91_20735 [Chitinophaga costaii]
MFAVYTLITIIVLIMLKIGFLTYLNQLTDSIIFIILLIGLLTSFFLRWGINKTKNKMQMTLLFTSSVFILLMLYFTFEDLKIVS